MLGQLGGTEARAGFRVLVAKQVVAHAKELRRGTRSIMLQALGQIAGRLLRDLRGSLVHPRREDSQRPLGSAASRTYRPLQRVIITDDVARTLFGEYAGHHASARGDEEIGWDLLGLRREHEAVVMATLPAGANRDASAGHVLFNSGGQVVGSRYVRQADRRLTIVGIVHTHPGSLRHPSDGDFRGDSIWVGQLRGQDGIFGIGTADNHPPNGSEVAYQPRPHVQCLGKLRFSWYALGSGEKNYRPLPAEFTLGPDLARPLHSVWASVERHAEPIERLFRQQTGLTLEVIAAMKGPALAVNVPLAEPGQSIRVLLEEDRTTYYWVHDGVPVAAEPHEPRIDRAVYLLLAELAAGAPESLPEKGN